MPRALGTTLACVLALAATACSGDGEPAPPETGSSGTGSQIVAIPASSDLFAGEPQRVAFGLLTHEGGFVSFGTADLDFRFVGTAAEPTEPQPGPSAEAAFIPTYGSPNGTGGPTVTTGIEGRGVYQASDVVFDRAGFWTATVELDVEGLGPQSAEATVAVAEQAGIPSPGDRAPTTENLTADSNGVPPEAIDSRASNGRPIPDPALHEWTIADAIAQGRPALAVFATPEFCTSRFCGPVVDMVEDLARRYDDRAVFIHVEFWKDFNATPQVVNEAAAEWLQMPDGSMTEPWLFLIDADGVVADRWSSMWSDAEVEAALEALPPMRAG